MEFLLDPEKWMEAPVSTVTAAMGKHGVRKLQLSVDANGKPVAAILVIVGEDTPEMLNAIAKKEDELDARNEGGQP